MRTFNLILILSAGLVSNTFCDNQDKMPKELINALIGGHLKKVRSLQKHLHKKIWKGETPLHFATSSGDKISFPLIKYLIEEKDFDVNEKNDENVTPFYNLAGRRSILSPKELLEITKYFLDKGANLNIINSYGFTPLDTFCRSGNKEIVSYIIKNRGKSISPESIDSTIKRLKDSIKQMEIEPVFSPKTSEEAKARTRKRIAEFKKSYPLILKMLNDLKAKKSKEK